MKKLLTAAAVAVGLALAPAQAATIDFANEADTNGERGLADGSSITIDGYDLTLITYGGGPNSNGLFGAGGNPYLDAGNAGLGVCQVLDANDQCDPGSDDSIQLVNNGTEVEGIGIFFDNGPVTITDLLFIDGRHNPINAMNDGLVDVFLAPTATPTFTALFTDLISMVTSGDPMFEDLGFIGFVFVDTAFYVSSITVSDVPIPGAIPLLLSGIAGLGFASRKKKAA